MTPHPPGAERSLAPLAIDEFERTLDKLENTRPFAKALHQTRLLTLAMKLMHSEDGIDAMYRLAPRFDAAGVFHGGDWALPEQLEAGLVRGTLTSGDTWPALECLNQLRFLAIARGHVTHPVISAEMAQAFLDDVLARNLDFLFPEATEVTRHEGRAADGIRRLFAFIAARLGTAGMIGALVTECERVLLQRPIMIRRVEDMLRTVAHALDEKDADAPADVLAHARWMIDALEGPSPLSRAHPSADDYALALAELDPGALAEEAALFGRRMDRSGLVSRAHAALVRYLAVENADLLPACLALNRVGITAFEEFKPLILAIIDRAVLPDTRRCIYGLSRLLNRGILFFRPVAPGLQHLLIAPIVPAVADTLQDACELAAPPDARALLLAGTLSVIGQPRGVDQGHNPTCQAARAISLWSQNDVGYLLEIIASAAVEDDVVMHFEGEELHSRDLEFGLAEELHTELDAVSLLLTPHLDRIYMAMSGRTIGRGGDGHRWVNPEFHGWWVQRGFAALVDAETEAVIDFDGFVRQFYAAYHPDYNGGRDLVYAQPCGVVSTTPAGEFVGWHAVSIQRVDRDPAGNWRVYFYNPNRDKGQNWGHGIVTSTSDHGELEGESSLPFEQFVMRLYVFHYAPRELGDPAAVPAGTVELIRTAVLASWAADREWQPAEEA